MQSAHKYCSDTGITRSTHRCSEWESVYAHEWGVSTVIRLS